MSSMRDANRQTCTGSAANLGNGLTVQKSIVARDGDCNFCSGNGQYDNAVIHVLEGQRCSVRLCDECLKKVKAYKP